MESVVSYPDSRHSSGWITSPLRGSRVWRISRQNRGQWNVIINIKSYQCHALRVLAEQEAAACVKVMSDTAPSVSSEVNTPMQRKRSSDNRGDLVGNQLSRACSAKD